MTKYWGKSQLAIHIHASALATPTTVTMNLLQPNSQVRWLSVHLNGEPKPFHLLVYKGTHESSHETDYNTLIAGLKLFYIF